MFGLLFSLALLILYKLTIKKVKLDYPLVAPDGKPDVYSSYNIPRPIFEDEQGYPWYFNKKKFNKKIEAKDDEKESMKRSVIGRFRERTQKEED